MVVWFGPADAAGAGILFVIADERNDALDVVLVGQRNRGAEEGARFVGLLGGVDHPRCERSVQVSVAWRPR